MTRFKKFRIFWPCSFVDPSEKVTDSFWKVRGLIDRFNKLRRQTDSGVKKTADESMNPIQFCITPNEYLPHYSYIFRKTKPLGKDMKNVAGSSLGKMLHLDNQKGKEAMKTSKFQKYTVGTTARM